MEIQFSEIGCMILCFEFDTLSKKWILSLFCAEVLIEPGIP